MDGPTVVAIVSITVGATASVLASVLAPLVAGKNQRKADLARFEHDAAATEKRLAHERRIEAARLAHEHKTEDARFAHERASRIREEVRELLDEFAYVLPDAIRAQITLSSKSTRVGAAHFDAFGEEIAAFTDLRERLIRSHTRLLIRLGIESEIVKVLGDVIDVWRDPGGSVRSV